MFYKIVGSVVVVVLSVVVVRVLFYVLFCCYSYALDLLNHRQQSIKSNLKEI